MRDTYQKIYFVFKNNIILICFFSSFFYILNSNTYFLGTTDYVWGALSTEIKFFYDKILFLDHWDRNNLGQPLLSHGYLPLYSIDRLFYIFLPKEYFLIINNTLFLIKLFFVYKTTILIIKNNDVYNPILSKLNISILFSGFFIYCIVFQSQLTQLLFLLLSLLFILKYKKNNNVNYLIYFFLSVFIFCSSGMLDDSFNILIWVNLFLLYYLIKKILFKQFCFLIILQLPSVIFLFSNLYPLLIESSVNFFTNIVFISCMKIFFLKY